MPTKENLIWADEQVQHLLDLFGQASKSATAMIEFNAARYTLIYQLAQGRIPF